MTPTLAVTTVSAFIGFILNSTVFYLVLSKGRQFYHYLFAGVLFICALWDLGIVLAMLRNEHPVELIYIGYIVTIPCTLLIPFVFHFTCSYLDCPKTKTTYFLWITTGGIAILMSLGILLRSSSIAPLGKIVGIYAYDWGNIWRGDDNWRNGLMLAIPAYYIVFAAVCWFLYKRLRVENSRIERRHLTYILVGFIAMGLAGTKVLAVTGVDWPILLPAGMALNDIFVAIIGIAIIKDRLLDITLVIKRGAIFSVIIAGVVFIFSFSEHMLATYVGEKLGENSIIIHMISIAVVIAILMPVKHWLEKLLNSYFKSRQINF